METQSTQRLSQTEIKAVTACSGSKNYAALGRLALSGLCGIASIDAMPEEPSEGELYTFDKCYADLGEIAKNILGE